VLDIRRTISTVFCLFRFVVRTLIYRECGKAFAPNPVQFPQCFFGGQIVVSDGERLIFGVEEHYQFQVH
jgi:hypothetical protein